VDIGSEWLYQVREDTDMKVLIISSNSLATSPSGPAYVAGAAQKAGHTVEIFDCLFAQDLERELEDQVIRFNPDVIGVSIRLVTGDLIDESAEFNTRFFDARPQVKEIIRCIKKTSNAHIVLGGPGFNYYGRDWLKYLDLDYGLRGEAEFSFPLYLKKLEEGGDVYDVPGCIFRKNGSIFKIPRDCIENLDSTAFPAYELFDVDRYSACGVSPGVSTKRGCRFRCTFCPYASLEGRGYRLKSPGRIVDEMEHIQRATQSEAVTFCDNSFNMPKRHAEGICEEIIKRKLNIKWGTGSLKPVGITDAFCQLLKDSGCDYINLAIESASEKMLEKMKRGYRTDQVEEALACFGRADIPFGVSLMMGTPGETPETVAETLSLMDRFQVPLEIWMTIGICLWTDHQSMLEDARREGQLKEDRELFDGAYYISPELPKEYMIDLIESLNARPNWVVQANKAYAEYR